MEKRVGIDTLSVLPIRSYSDLNPEELRATQNFNAALNMIDANCKNKPELWSDYDEEHIPSPEYATALCAFCPLAALCMKDAEVMKPGWTVRAGEVYVFGHRYYEGVYNPDKEEEDDDSNNE